MAIITHLAAMYNVLFMIMMSWMSSLCRWVLFLPGLWPTNAGYCFVSARRGQKKSLHVLTLRFITVAAAVRNAWISQFSSTVSWASGQTLTHNPHHRCRLSSSCDHNLQAKNVLHSTMQSLYCEWLWMKALGLNKQCDTGAGLCDAGWLLFQLSRPGVRWVQR